MPGVRLRHPILKGCVYTVEHPRKYLVPLLCGTCGHPHVQKTYHLYLGSDGSVIVSETVYERLREVQLAGLELMNEVAAPPAIILDLNRRPNGRPLDIRRWRN